MYVETAHNEKRMLRFNIIDLTLDEIITIANMMEPHRHKNNLPVKLALKITEAANIEIEKLIAVCN